jgi:hypothetical protein
MRPPDDDPDVKAFFRRDEPSSTDPQDAAVMRAAADVLRALNSDRPPTASLELAALMAQGTTRSNPMKTHTRAALTRFAGLGVAAKVMLAGTVAIAGVGGAATAVALSTGHLDSHQSNHHATHPRGSDDQSPEPSQSPEHHGDAAHTPGADDTTPEPSESAERGEHHGDRGGDHDGDKDGDRHGSNRSPGGPPSASGHNGNGDGDGNGGGNGSPGGPPTPNPSASGGHGGPGSGDDNGGGGNDGGDGGHGGHGGGGGDDGSGGSDG